jgi:hypothetical protein
MEVKKPKISQEILKVSQVPTRKPATYGGGETSRQTENLNASDFQSVLRRSRGVRDQFPGIRVYIAVIATLKSVYYFKKIFYYK